MPRLLTVGHVTRDLIQGQEVVGGSVCYAALAARKLGWDPAVLTAAAADFDPVRDLGDVPVYWRRGAATTRFRHEHQEDGTRRQFLLSRADDIDLTVLPDEWRAPDVLLLSPVAGEIHGALAPAFEARVVGAIAQGWLREVELDGQVVSSAWLDPACSLEGVHVLFLSEHDLPKADAQAREWLRLVPVVIVTRGWRGLTLITRAAEHEIPTLPREEVDSTGAGDVFASAFLIRYHETEDLLAAAAFAACAASCVVEGLGPTALGDRAEVHRRLELRERLLDDGEWDE